MSDRTTRLEKEQAKNRRLQKLNAALQLENKELTERIDKIRQCNETEQGNPNMIKIIFSYIYDIAVSAVILVFVYWIAIKGYEKFDVPYNYFCVLFILILLKLLWNNKEYRIRIILQVIMNDLLKPFLAMLLGLLLCMFSLGESWREASGYALDVASTGIVVLTVGVATIVIAIMTYIYNKIKKSKRLCVRTGNEDM